MSPTSGLYNLFVPQRQPPPYNKVAKLVMTVEVETVQIRNTQGGAPLQSERKYPHYPVLERSVETVDGNGNVLTGETTIMNPPPSAGSSWSSSYASSPAASEASDSPEYSSAPWPWSRQKQGKLSESSSSAESSWPRRSGSFSSVGSFGSGWSRSVVSESETRVVGVVKSDGKMKMFEGDGVVLDEHLADPTSPASWPEEKNKFTRRERDHPNYRAMHLEEKRKREEGLMTA
ncbi:hypothetical protein F5144DRAFT_593148 [Chaetomium tenue]|uniref:Uncharacterized protein n=1 Tax=Chaetomium tenue TaxID=1854479 RepID=A0ACB7P8G9_9PEZI|nr:hypothetical protein F5144DRAFT_593148 [Chaetomium globosum]